MDKEELSKILRSLSNSEKDKIKKYRDFESELKKECHVKESATDKDIKVYYVLKSLLLSINLGLAAYNLSQEEYSLFALWMLYFLISIPEVKDFSKNISLKKDIDELREKISVSDSRVLSLETSIEFLQSLTKEEEKKYLKLK